LLSTIHSAKGLEWDTVLLIGVEDGVLPHTNCKDLEEERRVAYVGMTRARRQLGLTYSAERYGQKSRPSPFLFEVGGKSCRSHPGRHILPIMATRTNQTPCPFTPKEREYIRRELDIFFGTLPSVADGFQLRTWRGGPHAGQPKIPPPLRTTVDSGLMEVRTCAPLPKAFFTESGLAALRLLASDRRHMDPQKFAHIRTELGVQAKADLTSDPSK
jgi:hypothetical protein